MMTAPYTEYQLEEIYQAGFELSERMIPIDWRLKKGKISVFLFHTENGWLVEIWRNYSDHGPKIGHLLSTNLNRILGYVEGFLEGVKQS